MAEGLDIELAEQGGIWRFPLLRALAVLAMYAFKYGYWGMIGALAFTLACGVVIGLVAVGLAIA